MDHYFYINNDSLVTNRNIIVLLRFYYLPWPSWFGYGVLVISFLLDLDKVKIILDLFLLEHFELCYLSACLKVTLLSLYIYI